MAQENWQKYKLLKLLELLRQETDEQQSSTHQCNLQSAGRDGHFV